MVELLPMEENNPNNWINLTTLARCKLSKCYAKENPRSLGGQKTAPGLSRSRLFIPSV